jgi:Ca2+-binding RTX toxin-like protein
MADFLITTVVNSSQNLLANEFGIVARGGVLANTVTMQPATGNANLMVQGSIATSGAAVLFNAGTADSVISVAQGGSIAARYGLLSFAAQDSITLSNAGSIDAIYGVVISAFTTPVSIVNTGLMQTSVRGLIPLLSYQAAVINVQGTSLTLNNAGDIVGPEYGIFTGASTQSSIVNTGLISAQIAMDLGSAADRVVNGGTIRGTVNLFSGADLFDGRTGRQIGLVSGAGGNDTLFGGSWDDSLSGGDNNDVVRGGAGDDVALGGTGLDTLRGGLGDDTITGGPGADVFVFARGQGTDRITDFVNGADRLDLRAFDFASLTAVAALASPSTSGLRIDLPGEGMLFVQGLTLATLTAGDVLL